MSPSGERAPTPRKKAASAESLIERIYGRHVQKALRGPVSEQEKAAGSEVRALTQTRSYQAM